MLFTSPIFLMLFLPITILLYFIADKKYKNLILCIASLIFYSWGGAIYLILVLILIIINYIMRNTNKQTRKTQKSITNSNNNHRPRSTSILQIL